MARANETRAAQGLQQVRRRIDIWRWTRLKRSPMPKELWVQAAKLARSLGVSRVARDLGLCYESLNQRAEEKASQKKAGTVRFVEVRGAVISHKNPKTTACKILIFTGGGMDGVVVESEGGS